MPQGPSGPIFILVAAKRIVKHTTAHTYLATIEKVFMMTSGLVDRTYYDILEVSKETSDLEIKKAYRRLALLHHPDRNNGSAESAERFQEIGEAYNCLSNPFVEARL